VLDFKSGFGNVTLRFVQSHFLVEPPLRRINHKVYLLQCLVKKDPVRRQILRVKGCLAGSKAHGVLEQGDMVLAIGGEAVTCFRDVENACQHSEEYGGVLKITVLRQVRFFCFHRKGY
jgi:hypothetical protein